MFHASRCCINNWQLAFNNLHVIIISLLLCTVKLTFTGTPIKLWFGENLLNSPRVYEICAFIYVCISMNLHLFVCPHEVAVGVHIAYSQAHYNA